MKRRTVLGGGALTLLGGGAVGRTLGVGPLGSNSDSRPAYLESEPITYEREPLQLRAPTDAVRRGESITFEIHHTGESEDVSLGCNIPWAIQTDEDGAWNHLVWTDQRWLLLCLTMLSPGDTATVTVPLSPSELADGHGVSEEEADVTFTPGKYRFVVLSDPPVAVNFRVLPAE
ncbi:hypothetical protein [Halosimplex sp. J119]